MIERAVMRNRYLCLEISKQHNTTKKGRHDQVINLTRPPHVVQSGNDGHEETAINLTEAHAHFHT